MNPKKIHTTIHSFLSESKVSDKMKEILNTDRVYDIQFNGLASKEGWKISIAGSTIDHIYDVHSRLHNYLTLKKIAHKVATRKRISSGIPEQDKKIYTIYVPDGQDLPKLLHKIEYLLKGYKGWQNIRLPLKGYEVYSGGISFRNDRDSSGNYIPATSLQ
jgi:hypothetical protein